MFANFKDFLVNKLLGRLLVRGIASAATALATGQLGFTFELTPNQIVQLVAAATAGANMLISKLKPRAPAEAPKA